MLQQQSRRQIGIWLHATAGAVFGMVVLGGVTRLTRSGLSMVDWKPQQGWPPRTEEEWDAEFTKYKQFPEYQKINRWMDVEEFKKIYYMEFAHRTYGRALGLLYGAPLAYFILSGKVKQAGGARLQFALLGFLALGGAQGLVGWWMVKSGLKEQDILTSEPRVSPYRLCAHLTTAVALYSGLMWTAMSMKRPNLVIPSNLIPRNFRVASLATTALVGTTMLSGAFVAGNDAGRAFNDWPLYAGRYVPVGIWKPELGYRNLLENTATVQFDHRNLAYGSLASVTMCWAYAERNLRKQRVILLGFRALAALVYAQAALGIVTLVTIVPVSLGAAHQAGALTVWTFALRAQHVMRYVK